MPRRSNRFWLVAFITAWAVDFLFYGRAVGVSLFIWLGLLLAGGLWLAHGEGHRPAALSWLLMGLILLTGAIAFVRAEPFSQAISVLVSLAGLLLLAATFRNGHWLFYRTLDIIRELLGVVGAALVRPAGLFKPREATAEPVQAGQQTFWKSAAPVLRGILLAIPVVAVLGLLLSSADLVFADRMKTLFSFFEVERLPEYLFRLVYILILTYLFTGVYLHAILPTRTAPHPDERAPLITPFLGWIESVIVLGAVVFLFAFFVGLQFQYLFGGQANITAAGYTYSEYARRGFGELVAVAVISLLLTLTLGSISRREEGRRRTVFTVLTAVLLALVLVILASALQRLLLYEQAYGFTRLRTYTLLFIPWLALLLLAAIGLEVSRHGRRFGFALLVAVVGFGLTLGAWNVDGFIARQNIERGLRGEEFDRAYLAGLSTDAIPVLLDYYHQPGLESEIHDGIGAALACQAAVLEHEPQPDWRPFTIGRAAATRALTGEDWSAYVVERSDGYYSVTVNGVREFCGGD